MRLGDYATVRDYLTTRLPHNQRQVEKVRRHESAVLVRANVAVRALRSYDAALIEIVHRCCCTHTIVAGVNCRAAGV